MRSRLARTRFELITGLRWTTPTALVRLLDTHKAAKYRKVDPKVLEESLTLQRKAQWRVDYINAENSMGFHAPQEAARILGEAIDYARQGQLKVLGSKQLSSL